MVFCIEEQGEANGDIIGEENGRSAFFIVKGYPLGCVVWGVVVGEEKEGSGKKAECHADEHIDEGWYVYFFI